MYLRLVNQTNFFLYGSKNKNSYFELLALDKAYLDKNNQYKTFHVYHYCFSLFSYFMVKLEGTFFCQSCPSKRDPRAKIITHH